jgi:CRP-like cAMP-binding protein
MEAADFRRALAASPALQQVMERYLFVRMTQLAQATACTRFHFVEARLARWFLLTQDRAHSSGFHVTHEFLARMLGVRRSGVTQAATALQSRGLIRYSRGNVTVLDRVGLLAAACACYRIDGDTYRNAMG